MVILTLILFVALFFTFEMTTTITSNSSLTNDPNSLFAHPHHVYLLVVQSNMVRYDGIRGSWDRVVPPECQPSPQIFRLDCMLSWSMAKEPLHAGIYPRDKLARIGPGMPFAKHILELELGFGTNGLVPCVFGGTSMDEWCCNYTQRNSPSNLYWNLIFRAKASERTAGRLAGLMWWQGGADAVHKEVAS
ncbi:hypothetical protein SAY87_021535 [Trapa incisa]|uniref:Sialate O-acetylesterase domain-containing protein n=1 Tax=Trapa incisa TaxID=236973 RepID=A0AAN7JTD5_9MYRT|nr:hypothetical protein SAY87_021535 [Trapa incisa]